MNNLVKLILSLLVCLGGGTLSGAFVKVGTWYDTLEKPAWTPPAWVFGPVWTFLYILMGISLWLVWIKKPKDKTPYILFFTQLFFNFIWTSLFFGLESPLLALIDLGLILGFLIATIFSFWKVSRFAGGLLIPYLLWGLYAFALNVQIVWLSM